MSEKLSTPTIGQVIGQKVREWRRARRMSQDVLARELVAVGLPWTRSHIASLEIGRREDLTLSELLRLSQVCHEPLEYWLKDDPGGAGSVLVAGIVETRLRMDHVAKGQIVAPPGSPAGQLGAFESTATEAQWRNAAAAITDIEANAAKRLGVAPPEVRAAALGLWGRDLIEEREFRVDNVSNFADRQAAQRGHITRKLLRELASSQKLLRKVLDQARGGALPPHDESPNLAGRAAEPGDDPAVRTLAGAPDRRKTK